MFCSNSFIIGNKTKKFINGQDNPTKNIHSCAHEIILRNSHIHPGDLDFDANDPEKNTKKVYLESYDFDRLERIHYLKSTVHENSNTNPQDEPDYTQSIGKPKGHATNVTVDHQRWRKREEIEGFGDWYASKDGAPQWFPDLAA